VNGWRTVNGLCTLTRWHLPSVIVMLVTWHRLKITQGIYNYQSVWTENIICIVTDSDLEYCHWYISEKWQWQRILYLRIYNHETLYLTLTVTLTLLRNTLPATCGKLTFWQVGQYYWFCCGCPYGIDTEYRHGFHPKFLLWFHYFFAEMSIFSIH